MPYSARMSAKAPPYRTYRYAAARTIQDAIRRRQQAPKAITTTKPAVKSKTPSLRLTKPMKSLVDKRINKHLEKKDLKK